MNAKPRWEKRGLILEPSREIGWLATSAGPCFARLDPEQAHVAQLYVSGRDERHRSRIGRVLFDLEQERILEIVSEAVLPLGGKGAFDENGTSYPCIVETCGVHYLYYTGWIQGVQVRWYNDLGLASSRDGLTFQRVSRAPIFQRNDKDFIGIGSSCVLKDGLTWRMWYTRFERWGAGREDHEHYYNIKHAKSEDGIHWAADDHVCIDFADASEYAIAKPCVLKVGETLAMWYSHRGAFYRGGLARSTDGIHWQRMDERVGIDVAAGGWDSEMLCYPFVLDAGETFYMFYNGNGYGASGLGLAKAGRATVLEMIHG